MKNRLVLILIDGMRSDALENTESKYLLSLAEKSASCLKASSVMPSVTLPCHSSLFLGVMPERHGITTNNWSPLVRPVDSFMDIARREGLKTAMFYNWENLRDLNKAGSLDHSDFNVLSLDYYRDKAKFSRDIHSEVEMTNRALKYFNEEIPDVSFIYFGLTDEAGHYFGWMSEEYMAALSNAENCVKKIRESLDDSWQIIITADHGGHQKAHGLDIPEDMTIPMIFSGSNFEAGKKYRNLNLTDIAPTIAEIIKIKPDPQWTGNNILEEN